MSDQTGGDDGGSIIWTILKIVAAIVAIIFALRLIFWLIGGVFSLFFALLPLLVILGLGYFLYKVLSGSDNDEISGGDPKLLEYEEEDPLDRRFKELEAEESRVNAMLKDLDRE